VKKTSFSRTSSIIIIDHHYLESTNQIRPFCFLPFCFSRKKVAFFYPTLGTSHRKRHNASFFESIEPYLFSGTLLLFAQKSGLFLPYSRDVTPKKARIILDGLFLPHSRMSHRKRHASFFESNRTFRTLLLFAGCHTEKGSFLYFFLNCFA
jgi:hypothetical protein